MQVKNWLDTIDSAIEIMGLVRDELNARGVSLDEVAPVYAVIKILSEEKQNITTELNAFLDESAPSIYDADSETEVQ